MESNHSSFISKRPEPLQLPPKLTSHWKELKTSGKNVPIRSYSALALTEHAFYLFGGLQILKGPRNDLYRMRLKQETNIWQHIEQKGTWPESRSRHSLLYSDGSLYLFGGVSSNLQSLSKVYKFSIETQTWTMLNSEGPQIDSHGAVIFQGKMIVLCGFDSRLYTQTNAVYEFDTKAQTWINLYPHNAKGHVQPRAAFGCCAFQGVIYGFGGKAGSSRLDDLWSFDNANKYQKIETKGSPLSRSGCGLSCYNGTLILFGGMHEVTWQLQDLQFFKLGGHQWEQQQSQSSRMRDRSDNEFLSKTFLKQDDSASPGYGRKGKKKQVTSSISSPFRMLDQQKRKNFLIKKKKLLGQFQIAQNQKDSYLIEEPQSQALLDAINHTTQPSLNCKVSFKTRTTYSKFMEPIKSGMNIVLGRRPCARDGHCQVVWEDKLVVFGGDRHQMSFNDLFFLQIDAS